MTKDMRSAVAEAMASPDARDRLGIEAWSINNDALDVVVSTPDDLDVIYYSGRVDEWLYQQGCSPTGGVNVQPVALGLTPLAGIDGPDRGWEFTSDVNVGWRTVQVVHATGIEESAPIVALVDTDMPSLRSWGATFEEAARHLAQIVRNLDGSPSYDVVQVTEKSPTLMGDAPG